MKTKEQQQISCAYRVEPFADENCNHILPDLPTMKVKLEE